MVTEVNADNFDQEVLQADVPVLVDFWGPSCGPCLALRPDVEKLAEKHEGSLKVVALDASQNKRLCLNLQVLGLPTFLIFKNGEEIDRLKGGELKIQEIEAAVDRVLNQ